MNVYLKILVRALLGAGMAGSALLTSTLGAAPAGAEVRVAWLPVAVSAASAFFTTFYAGWAALDDTPAGMTQVPTSSVMSGTPLAMDDRVYPLRCWLALLAAGMLAIGGCASAPTPQEAFSRSCASVGEAMVQVNQQRRDGVIDDATFVAIDDAYDAAVETCMTLPPPGAPAGAALAKVNEFLARAGAATGTPYSY